MSNEKKPTSPSSGSGSNASPKNPVGECSCTVTLSPKDIKLCGKDKTKVVTATGTPAGGSYSFSSSDSSIATVTGNANKGTIKAVKKGTATIKVTYTTAGCPPCTDTVTVKVCTCTPGRQYVFAMKSLTGITGVKAKIKTRYGKLCCEDENCNTDTAYNVVFVSISNDESATHLWGQAGFGRERNEGSTAIKKYRYAEMNAGTYKVNYDTANAPAEGSIHTYQCELDKSTGTLKFSFDGTVWETFADNSWKNITANSTKAVEEIYNKEDDMAGTDGNKCEVTDWQYREDGGGYKDVDITDADLTNYDSNEWGIERVSGTAVNMWDKKPL